MISSSSSFLFYVIQSWPAAVPPRAAAEAPAHKRQRPNSQASIDARIARLEPNTHHRASEFEDDEQVLAWWAGEKNGQFEHGWYLARVMSVNRERNTLVLRFHGERANVSDYQPHHVRFTNEASDSE